MAAWMHYFTFKANDEFSGYWVEVNASSNRKAQYKMEELYYGRWDKHYNQFNFPRWDHPKGCLAHHEVDDA
jgi:hypothetical protein